MFGVPYQEPMDTDCDDITALGMSGVSSLGGWLSEGGKGLTVYVEKWLDDGILLNGGDNKAA